MVTFDAEARATGETRLGAVDAAGFGGGKERSTEGARPGDAGAACPGSGEVGASLTRTGGASDGPGGAEEERGLAPGEPTKSLVAIG